MPTTSPVISRLQNQRSRIQGMLSPGKKLRQPGVLNHAPLSPVASDFTGRKYQFAARKMRSLDAGKLGQTLSSSLTSLSTDIRSKFADIQKIIHINPGTSRQDKSIWSSLETPLPDTQPDRQEASLDPDVMRAGTIIQKMSSVPQPGQSLDSFKEQVKKQPHSTRSAPDKRPVINKNTRRFSQVQEVTPGQKQSFPEIPAAPVKPDETQPPVIRSREAPDTATIQPQPDPSSSIPDKTVITSRVETLLPKPPRASAPPELPAQPVKKDPLPELPLRAKSRASQPVTRAAQQTPPDEVAAQPSELKVAQPTDGQKDAVRVSDTHAGPPQAQKPVQEKEILKALPVAKKPPVQDELKKALPLKKDQKEPQKPVARPTLKSRTEPPAAPVHPAIQRQPDAHVSPPAPALPFIQPPTDTELPVAAPLRPAIQQPTDADLPIAAPVLPIQQPPQTTAPSVKLPASPAPSVTDPGIPEMPLRQNIGYRKNASQVIRAIAPDQMKPVSQLPLIHRTETPLLTRSKYRTTSIESSPPVQSTRKDSAPYQKQVHPQSPPGIPETYSTDMPHSRLVPQAPIPQNLSPIPMPLASPSAAPAPVKQAPKSEAIISPAQSQLAQIPRPTPTLAKTNNTIQRTWEGHTPPAQTSSDRSAGDNDRSESTDLQALAENVFPYVKRILEIEANRSSGKLS